MLIDSHCHLDFPDFADDLDGIVGRARTAGIGRLVTISTRVKRHAELLAITERFPDVYCSVGTHPHNAHEELDVTAGDLVALTRAPKVVALGEAGLDYHYDNSPCDAQERGFRIHIAAARQTGLPLVIHTREADADAARILEEETGKGAFPAVLHCYTGGPDLARRAIALGLYISFTGILTFKNSAALRDIAASLPADRILVETDAPFLAPASSGVSGTNRPMSLKPRKSWRMLAACRSTILRARPRRISSGCSARCRSPRGGRLTLKFTILGCGSSGGIPRPALGWGDCDPNNPKNRRRRTSFLIERRPHP